MNSNGADQKDSPGSAQHQQLDKGLTRARSNCHLFAMIWHRRAVRLGSRGFMAVTYKKGADPCSSAATS